MAKRFTDTDLWKSQRWFRKLNPIFKLVFCYVKDQCNHAGIWKIDCSDLVEDLGLEDFNLTEFTNNVNVEYDKISGKKINKERLRIIDKKYLWLTGFVQFQYEGKEGKVKWENTPAVISALKGLDGIGILSEGITKGYLHLHEPLRVGWQTHKDKDKDKDNNREGGKKKIDKNIFGISFTKDKLYVVLSNGEKQVLGKSQKVQVDHNSIEPKDIYKNFIV